MVYTLPKQRCKFMLHLKLAFLYSVYLIGVTSVLLISMETVLYFLARISTPHVPAANVDGTGNTESTEILEIQKEQRQCTLGLAKHVPYVEWAGRPYSGRYVNITQDTLRRTVNISCERPSIVHVYGGSGVWGSGVADSDTIPSWLARTLSEETADCWYVENFGEGGYVSSQDLNRFISNVRRGNIPQVAIFHEGMNDAIVTYMQLPPSYHGFYSLFSERIDAYNNSRRALVLRLIKASLIYQRIESALSNFRKPDPPRVDPDRIRESVKTYVANLRLAKIIGDAYGVKTIFLLQPTIYTTKKRLVGTELDAAVSADDPFAKLVVQFYSMVISEGANVGLVDLSSIFDDWDTRALLDYCHLFPAGNREVARRISDLLVGPAGLKKR